MKSEIADWKYLNPVKIRCVSYMSHPILGIQEMKIYQCGREYGLLYLVRFQDCYNFHKNYEDPENFSCKSDRFQM